MNETESLNSELGTDKVIWKLTDLYTSPECIEFTGDIDWCEREAQELCSKYRTTIKSISPEELFTLTTRIEKLETRIGRLATYAFLHFTTQVDNEQAGALYQKIHELANKCGKETVFFELEWNKIDEDQSTALLENTIFDTYRHYMTTMRRYRPHQLQEIEERLLIETKSVGRKSWTTLFEKVIGHLRFGKKGRTEEEVLSDLYHSEQDVRKQAADDMTAGLRSQEHILTHIYNTLAADKMINDRLRSHTVWVSSMNLDNQIADKTVDTLIDAVTQRYDIVNRYYKLKAELIGVDTLYDYDRYAPLPALPSTTIKWQECTGMVLDAFGNFSNRMKEIAEPFFTQSWIHAPIQPGKRGGAFAHPCVPEVHPYVLVNYTGTLRDVSTVAHELGHGVHQVLAADKGYFNSDTPLVLAETASVFAELLVFKSQLELIDKADEKRAFICQKIESIFATVFRQIAMNRFEHRMHEGRRERGELSSRQLGDFWIETQQEMFGDSVELRDDYRIWWSYIPHFLSSPGYVYSYAFGELLVLSLYNIYQNEGSAFADTYLELLSAGGSASPYDLLKPFDIHLDDPTFWQQGLTVIEDMLTQVETL